MNSRETTYLILRIFALYIIITGLTMPMNYLYSFLFMSSQSSIAFQPISVVPMIIGLFPLLFGIYLWVSSKKLTGLFIYDSPAINYDDSAFSINVLKLAMVIMGLFLIVTNIPYIFQSIILFEQSPEELRTINPNYHNNLMQGLITHGISIFIGFSLIVGNKFYLNALQHFRNIGLNLPK